LPRTLGAAIRDLDSPKTSVRVSALHDLGRLARDADHRADAVEAMVRTLRADADAVARAEAAVALADAEATEAVPVLIEMAADAHLRVRQMVLVALGELSGASDSDALEVVYDALEQDEAALRFQALIALYRVLGDEALERVVDCTRDVDDHVRYVALRILEERWEETREALTMPVAVRVRALLRDDSAAVRLAAAILLGRGGDAIGAKELVAAVNGRSGAFELEDELAAVELVGQMRLADARGGLHRRAFGLFGGSNDASTFQARVSLAQLGDGRAVDAIVRGLSAWSRDTRTLAVAAAGRARLRVARPAILAMRGDAARADPHAVEEALALIDGSRSSS